jgi:hypothetical protein
MSLTQTEALTRVCAVDSAGKPLKSLFLIGGDPFFSCVSLVLFIKKPRTFYKAGIISVNAICSSSKGTGEKPSNSGIMGMAVS